MNRICRIFWRSVSIWIIENRDRFHDRETDIDDLAEKVANYDTYGQTGYLGMGVNNVILEKTLSRLEE